MTTHDEPTLCQDPLDDSTLPTVLSTESPILLFGLSIATALPPAAMLAPPGLIRPAVQSNLRAILDPLELTLALNRPTADLWRGQVRLGEIDERLHGLEMLLHVVRVIDGSGALVCLSTVSPDPTARGAAGARPADLWRLACEALARHGIAHEREAGIGEAAFLAVHGGVTAQVAWLAGDRLATASVTSLAGEKAWAVDAARSLAVVLDRRLNR
jgi:hypothetical protein